MTDQIYDLFYLIGKGVLLLSAIALAYFIAAQTKQASEKKQIKQKL